jgi:RNA polymerase sigma-70 factor (ECF subfamily)
VLAAVTDSGEVTWALAPAVDDRHGRRGDHALVRAAQRGETDALERLFRAHWGMAHRAAYLVVHDSAAAEDIAQEAFLAAVRALDRFDRRRPFAPWLHRIVVNRAIDHARARALRREVELAQAGGGGAVEPPAGGPDSVIEALAGLQPDQRAVIVLRHLLGYTPGEIADLLALRRGTVNSRLRRGLDAIRQRLEAEGAPGGPPRTVASGGNRTSPGARS